MDLSTSVDQRLFDRCLEKGTLTADIGFDNTGRLIAIEQIVCSVISAGSLGNGGRHSHPAKHREGTFERNPFCL